MASDSGDFFPTCSDRKFPFKKDYESQKSVLISRKKTLREENTTPVRQKA